MARLGVPCSFLAGARMRRGSPLPRSRGCQGVAVLRGRGERMLTYHAAPCPPPPFFFLLLFCNVKVANAM